MERTGQRRLDGSVIRLAAFNLRRLRFDSVATLVLAAVVALSAFAVVALPRFLNQTSDDALREAVRTAAPINRNMSIEQGMDIPPATDDVFGNVAARGDEFRGGFSEPVNEIIGDQRYVVDSVNFEVSTFPGDPVAPFPRFFRFRYQDEIAQHVTLIDGRLPQPAQSIDVALVEGQPAEALPVYEVAITQETADLMSAGLGDSIILRPQREDPLTSGATLTEIDFDIVATVSGIIQIDVPDAEYWFGDTRLHEPFVLENPDFVQIFGMGLMAPEAYGELRADTAPVLWRFNWRYYVEPDNLDAGKIGRISDELRTLEVQFGAAGLTGVGEPRLRSGLVRIVNVYESQRQLTISMLSLVIAALFVVATAVSALLGALIAARRTDSTLLSRSRGATAGQLGLAQALESLLLFAPAALIGYVAAVLIVSGRGSPIDLPLALVVAIVAAITVVVLAYPLLSRALGELLRSDRPVDAASGARLVIEGGIVVAALAGVILFRRRGLEAGSLSDPDQGFDPFLTAVPVLLSLALGVVILRVYPLAIRFLGWVGSLRRGAVGFVGFRRLHQQPLAARLPLVVMLVATGIAVFAGVVLFSITEGQQESTWQEVGADYRIQSVREDAPVSRLVEFSDVEGIEAIAEGASLQVRHADNVLPQGTIAMLAIDTVDYQSVAAGTRADPDFPEAMLIDQNVQEIGTDSNPIPAIVSSSLLGGDGLSSGDVLRFEVRRTEFSIVVREVRDRFSSLDPDDPFVVVPRDSLAAVDPTLDLRATAVYVRAPDSVGDELTETIRSQSLATEIVSRPELFHDLASAPLVDGVERGFRVTVVLATLYAVLAAVAGIALTARERARDIGYLRTLGLTARQASVLTAIEQTPPALFATVFGAALGFVLVWLIEPGLDLSTFAGTTLPTNVLLDPRVIGLVAGAELAALAIAIGAYSYVTRTMNLGNVLRLGDQT